MQQEDAGGRWDSRQGDRDLLMVGQPGPRTLLPARAAWQNGGRDGAIELARISCLKLVIFGWSFQAPSPLMALNTVVYWS